jgi:hypothetical protein
MELLGGAPVTELDGDGVRYLLDNTAEIGRQR